MSIEEPHHLAILTNYLVRPCPGSCKNIKFCSFYHTPAERRRCPFNGNELSYCEIMCPRISNGNLCEETCEYAHTFQEMVYHPNRYKVSWCEQANCKGYNLCYQAHKPNEKLRQVTQFTINESSFKNIFSSHLDLNNFKVNQCEIHEPHNPKLCIYYHSFRDKRRIHKYTFDMCIEGEKEMCTDTCNKSHNRVEQLYHPDKYKMKFCTFYPKKIHECDYGSYCSFAHSESDIKIELIHNYQRNEEFYMHSFKTVWCPFISQHDKAMCVYAHNWQDFRRKPKDFTYNSIPCPQWKASTFILTYEEGGCSGLLDCKKCHGWKEIEFHPNTYKMKPCTQGKKCAKPQDCPFYHSNKDKRTTDSSPLKEVSNHFTGVTPHPQKQFLSPDCVRGFQTPFINKQQPQPYFAASSKAEQVRHANSTTSDFVLHRGIPTRALGNTESSKRTSAATDEFFIHRESINIASTTPRKNQEKSDARVTQFLSRHKLKHLIDKFVGVKWEDLDTTHLSLPEDENSFQNAWNEEKEDMDQLDDLINNDIALFTGQKTGHTPDLKKFALQDDIDEIIVSFPKTSYIPSSLKCPITKKLMRDPTVFSLDGRTYERSAIIQHIESNYSFLEGQQLIQNLNGNKHIRQEILTRFI